MPDLLRLWLVEDDPAFRAPFEQFAEATPEVDLLDSFPTYEALVAASQQGAPAPDLLVLDLHLPGRSGPDAVVDARTRLPGTPILVLTSSDDAPTVFAALRAGASGYVVKGASPARLRLAIREVRDGGTYFSPSVASVVLGHFAPPVQTDPLTQRETEIVEHLSHGLTQGQIADALHLSEHTINSHLRKIYGKLHATSAAGAVGEAFRARLLPGLRRMA